jgi:hypothetical protein
MSLQIYFLITASPAQLQQFTESSAFVQWTQGRFNPNQRFHLRWNLDRTACIADVDVPENIAALSGDALETRDKVIAWLRDHPSVTVFGTVAEAFANSHNAALSYLAANRSEWEAQDADAV